MWLFRYRSIDSITQTRCRMSKVPLCSSPAHSFLTAWYHVAARRFGTNTSTKPFTKRGSPKKRHGKGHTRVPVGGNLSSFASNNQLLDELREVVASTSEPLGKKLPVSSRFKRVTSKTSAPPNASLQDTTVPHSHDATQKKENTSEENNVKERAAVSVSTLLADITEAQHELRNALAELDKLGVRSEKMLLNSTHLPPRDSEDVSSRVVPILRDRRAVNTLQPSSLDPLRAPTSLMETLVDAQPFTPVTPKEVRLEVAQELEKESDETTSLALEKTLSTSPSSSSSSSSMETICDQLRREIEQGETTTNIDAVDHLLSPIPQRMVEHSLVVNVIAEVLTLPSIIDKDTCLFDIVVRRSGSEWVGRVLCRSTTLTQYVQRHLAVGQLVQLFGTLVKEEDNNSRHVTSLLIQLDDPGSHLIILYDETGKTSLPK